MLFVGGGAKSSSSSASAKDREREGLSEGGGICCCGVVKLFCVKSCRSKVSAESAEKQLDALDVFSITIVMS